MAIIDRVKAAMAIPQNPERNIYAVGYKVDGGYLRLLYDGFRQEAVIFWERDRFSLEFKINPRCGMRISTRREGKDGKVFIGETRQALEKELDECSRLLNEKLTKNSKPVIIPSAIGYLLQGGFTAGGGISTSNGYTLITSLGAPGVIPYLTDDDKKKKGDAKR
ncbi:MAG: hypothetical protein CEN88_265 [Candidatus Berkelbacteria bacterium Licking1014_2]|uniref:Uncharacterized protein n=1 Tax=Candidatus Berkelbacteria bacterium Licking1014_2 TaxID=2017146 RepID=A0A554LV93_9BACT|nr:MAG: hypothetical protein CEN88_265 [Candidatus Berkelbacteria bacterium Licking1014_2]